MKIAFIAFIVYCFYYFHEIFPRRVTPQKSFFSNFSNVKLFNELYDCFIEPFPVPFNPLRLGIFLVLRKVEGNEVALVHIACCKIGCQLITTTFFILVASPNLQFNDKFLLAESHYQIHATIVTCLGLNVIEASTIDDGLEESEEQQSSLSLKEGHGAFAILLVNQVLEPCNHMLHVEFAISHIIENVGGRCVCLVLA